ncbi:spore germination protein GerKB [Halalkalibacter wakoensis JCM 9140]|uniref:Spore germination protein GerKB n=1 Tax=Halalkalibacter wakoensis JCM 9140 TaxID=1236970 RepID=W4Q1T8_9BACI|nr:GerAB/ArcD/ProY family transporter [Halalkalibacter wakoensis]GAE25703.1 spore germination protein GerKB [Halalkalibacter wakoensis JCM 9140]
MFIIVQTQIGVGILSLPYTIYESGAKTDAWISMLCVGVVLQVVIILFWFLSNWFPKTSFYDVLSQVYGKYVGRVLTIGYVIYFIFVCSLALILFNYIIEIWAFPRTPNWAFNLMMLILAYYLVIEKLKVIGRFHTLVSFLLVTIILLTFPAYPHLDIRYIMPIGDSGLVNIFKGTKEAILSVLGFELILFLMPFVKGTKREKFVSASLANIIVTVIYTYLTFICLLFFSPEEIKLVPEPVLYLLKAFTFPIIERVDIVFLAIWIISVVTTLISYVYIASIGLTCFFSMRHHKKAVPFIIVPSFFIALIPRNSISIANWSDTITNVGLFFVLGIPFLTALYIVIFKRNRVKTDVEKTS